MKILGALLTNDKRTNTVDITIRTAKKVNRLSYIEMFCFSDQKLAIQKGKENNLKVNIFERPEPDVKKITCSYWNLETGMRETELMQLSWLRNKALEKAKDYDYIYFIDSDLVIPEDAIEKLLLTEADIALGWYFHKRLPVLALAWKGKDIKNIDEDIKNEKIVDIYSGGNGGVLFNKNVIKNIRYDLYNGVKAEDTIFYQKARKQGIIIRADLGLHYQHLGYDWKPKAIKFAKEKSKIWKLKTPSFK